MKKPVMDRAVSQIGIEGVDIKGIFPKGCVGVCFVFESISAALANGCHKDNLMRIQFGPNGRKKELKKEATTSGRIKK